MSLSEHKNVYTDTMFAVRYVTAPAGAYSLHPFLFSSSFSSFFIGKITRVWGRGRHFVKFYFIWHRHSFTWGHKPLLSLRFPEVSQHTGSKWLIQSERRREVKYHHLTKLNLLNIIISLNLNLREVKF